MFSSFLGAETDIALLLTLLLKTITIPFYMILHIAIRHLASWTYYYLPLSLVLCHYLSLLPYHKKQNIVLPNILMETFLWADVEENTAAEYNTKIAQYKDRWITSTPIVQGLKYTWKSRYAINPNCLTERLHLSPVDWCYKHTFDWCQNLCGVKYAAWWMCSWR